MENKDAMTMKQKYLVTTITMIM